MHVIMTDYSPSMCLVCYCLGWWHVWWLPGGQEVTWDQSAGLMAASYSLALHSGSAPHSLSHSQSLTGAWASVCPWPGPSLSLLYLSPALLTVSTMTLRKVWPGWAGRPRLADHGTGLRLTARCQPDNTSLVTTQSRPPSSGQAQGPGPGHADIDMWLSWNDWMMLNISLVRLKDLQSRVWAAQIHCHHFGKITGRICHLVQKSAKPLIAGVISVLCISHFQLFSVITFLLIS